VRKNVNSSAPTLPSTPPEPQLPETQSASAQIYLKADCPLKLSEVFPNGVPVVDSQPTLLIGDWECYEVPRQAANPADLTIALFQPDTPVELCRVWLDRAIFAVPMDWVL
jgi:hypothetical protein